MQKIIYILIFNLLITGRISAQQTEIYTEPDRPYHTAYELFVKEKYSAAREIFDRYIATGKGSPVNLLNAEFYAAVSSYELFHPEAESRLIRFTEINPSSTRTPLAWFYLGRHYYRNKQYRNALPAFEKADVYYLSGDEVPEYYFKLGYCYFSKGENEKASKNFHEILNINSKYQTAAQYYYGHIAYSNDNYNTALEYFRKLDSSATFGPLVPYYITQMYYEQGKYDDVITYAVPVLNEKSPQNAADINRIVAESYFRKGDYKNALTYFDAYRSSTPVISRDDRYAIGYSNYRSGNYTAAIENFEKVADREDSLAQNAYFHLADCFLKTGNKQSARNAFQFAGKQNFNPRIAEISRFNYAKLSFELNYQPVAINAFRDFLKEHPGSVHTDEANELLARLYLTTKNYKDALTALENIKTKTARTQEAYQKVAYYRGVEFYFDGDKDKAINMFEKAIINDVDPLLRAQAMYWKAEVLYSQEKYDAAIKQYRIYIFNPASVNTSMYNLANYNMGYCYFRMNNYTDANTWYRKYLAGKDKQDDKIKDDCLIRTADCFYAMRDFGAAMDYYNQAIASNAASSDYCYFQRGLIHGLRGDLQSKDADMQKLLANYPKSKYKADAMFEKGRALMTMGNSDEALSLFSQINKDYPKSQYAKRAQLNTGLIHYNRKQDDQALAAFKDVINKYPGTPEATEALTSVKNIYVADGRPDEYFEYVKTVSNTTVSTGAQDSITYEAAEKRYLDSRFAEAAQDFEKYLTQFPNGAYRLNATFYKAECDFRTGDFEKALKGYSIITAEQKNIFTEKSLLKSGDLNFRANNYEQAIADYSRLEQNADLRDNIINSQTGLMRSYYRTSKFDQAITYAQKLLAAEKVSNEIIAESHLTYGRCAMQLNDMTAAKREFGALSKQGGDASAEAKYNLALIEYKLGNFKQSQNKCFEVINQKPSYHFWIAKSFLLLADNYIAVKDTFQAKHTLLSILDNFEKDPSDPEDIRAQAQQKYDELVKNEPGDLKPEEEAEPETDLSREQQN